MSEVKIYTVVSDDLSPPVIGESFCTGMVRHSDYAALEQKLTDMAVQLANAESKCAALAADNDKAMEAMRQADEVVKRAHSKFAALADENMALRSALENGMAAPETPANDAFLAEVRAQGVEMFADSLLCPDLDDTIREFADELRKGVQS